MVLALLAHEIFGRVMAAADLSSELSRQQQEVMRDYVLCLGSKGTVGQHVLLCSPTLILLLLVHVHVCSCFVFSAGSGVPAELWCLKSGTCS